MDICASVRILFIKKSVPFINEGDMGDDDFKWQAENGPINDLFFSLIELKDSSCKLTFTAFLLIFF